jgi:hypothetical protein
MFDIRDIHSIHNMQIHVLALALLSVVAANRTVLHRLSRTTRLCPNQTMISSNLGGIPRGDADGKVAKGCTVMETSKKNAIHLSTSGGGIPRGEEITSGKISNVSGAMKALSFLPPSSARPF